MITWIGHVVWPNYIVLPSIGGQNLWKSDPIILRISHDQFFSPKWRLVWTIFFPLLSSKYIFSKIKFWIYRDNRTIFFSKLRSKYISSYFYIGGRIMKLINTVCVAHSNPRSVFIGAGGGGGREADQESRSSGCAWFILEIFSSWIQTCQIHA